jgi:iron-sulfur cluster assembly accessory protein
MPLDELIESPIAFTDAAASALREYARTLPEAEGKRLRVAVRGGGCSGFSYALDYDTQRADEELFEHNGIPYLLDPVSDRYLRGTQIDYVKTALSGGFRFSNPNAHGSCGCGSSFNPE